MICKLIPKVKERELGGIFEVFTVFKNHRLFSKKGGLYLSMSL